MSQQVAMVLNSHSYSPLIKIDFVHARARVSSDYLAATLITPGSQLVPLVLVSSDVCGAHSRADSTDACTFTAFRVHSTRDRVAGLKSSPDDHRC